jgi:purine nucleosidase
MITPETHGPRGIGDAVLPVARRPLSERGGVELIVETARRRPGELTLIALGPATNLAAAVLREPELPRLLKRVVMMTGAFRVGGNTTPRSEWNAAVDPEALSVVLQAWAPDGPRRWDPAPPRPVIMALDVTEQARILPPHLDRFVARAGGLERPIVRFVVDALAFYRRFHEQYDGFDGAFIHDPLAVAVALEPALARTQAVTVDVELGGRLTTGETIADWRGHWGRPPNADVAVEADAAAPAAPGWGSRPPRPASWSASSSGSAGSLRRRADVPTSDGRPDQPAAGVARDGHQRDDGGRGARPALERGVRPRDRGSAHALPGWSGIPPGRRDRNAGLGRVVPGRDARHAAVALTAVRAWKTRPRPGRREAARPHR